VSDWLEKFRNRRNAVLEPGRLPGSFVWERVLKAKTWAGHVAAITSRDRGRRYEHWIQARLCNGGYDARMSPADAARRQARCAKICGLCRHINSLPVWPSANYRRPAQGVLEALEDEPYYVER